MHHSQYSGDIESFSSDVDDLTFEKAKELLIKLKQENKELKRIATRASFSIEQFKTLISLLDGVHNKENQDNNIKHMYQIFIQLVNALNNFAFWILMLIENATFPYCDENVKDICGLVKTMCADICDNCVEAKKSHNAFKNNEYKSGLNIKNLERPKERREKLQRLDCNQNSENGGDENRNSLQNDGTKCDEKQGKSLEPSASFHENDINEVSVEGHKSGLKTKNLEKTKVRRKRLQRLNCNQNSENEDDINRNSLQKDDTKCDEKQGKSTLELSTSTLENDKNEENGYIENQETCEEPEQKREKSFGISCLKRKNLLNKVRVEDNNRRQKFAVKSNENSSLLDQSSNACENDINEGENNSHPHVTSKRSRGYKRRHMLDTRENHVNEGKNIASQSSVSVPKRPCTSKRSHLPNMHGNDKNVNASDEGKINTLDIFVASQRSCRSNINSNNHFSNVHGSDIMECLSSSDRKHIRKGHPFVTSETETEDVASHEKPKRNKRGRKKKGNLMHEQKVKENFKSSDIVENLISFECDSISSSLKSGMSEPCVLLKDVLDDPNAQHYLDVIRYNERKKKESNVARCKEKNEMEESIFNKEGNEMETSQEWNVLDAASDEEDKESDNIESIGGQCSSNDDRQGFDSEVDAEEFMNDVAGEQPDNNSSYREQLDDSVNREGHDNERSYHSEHDDRSSNDNSDSETRMHERGYGPRTPLIHSKSDLGNCSKDDDDAPRNEDGATSPRPSTPDTRYGSKQSGSSSQSEASEVITVMDDEDFESSCD